MLKYYPEMELQSWTKYLVKIKEKRKKKSKIKKLKPFLSYTCFVKKRY